MLRDDNLPQRGAVLILPRGSLEPWSALRLITLAVVVGETGRVLPAAVPVGRVDACIGLDPTSGRCSPRPQIPRSGIGAASAWHTTALIPRAVRAFVLPGVVRTARPPADCWGCRTGARCATGSKGSGAAVTARLAAASARNLNRVWRGGLRSRCAAVLALPGIAAFLEGDGSDDEGGNRVGQVQPRVALRRRQTSRTADRYVHSRVCLGWVTWTSSPPRGGPGRTVSHHRWSHVRSAARSENRRLIEGPTTAAAGRTSLDPQLLTITPARNSTSTRPRPPAARRERGAGQTITGP